MTIEMLKDFGANTDEGLGRCLNNEALYLRLVGKAAEDASFDRLAAGAAAGDMNEAFEAAHALKGVLANLALTPLFEIASEMTELLRAKEDADYKGMLEKLLSKRDELRELLAK
jgi:HPt (histidine-containing phosphotransfer) domain-containing protein